MANKRVLSVFTLNPCFQDLAWSLRLHVESSKIPRFLCAYLCNERAYGNLLVLNGVAMSCEHDKFCFVIIFNNLFVIHIFISFIQASRRDIAVSFDTDTHSWKEIYNLVSST